MSRSGGLQAVFFDWAGTTIDHGSRAPAQVFVEIFRRSGIEITMAEAREPMGRAKRDHLATILAMPRVAAAWTAKHGAAATDADIDRLYADFLPLQKSTLAEHCDIIAGVPEVVAECRRRGLKIGSSTGYTRELMDVVVPIAAERGYAPDIDLGADDVAEGRPAPWMNFRIAERLGVYPLSSVVIVDDTSVGIQAGLNAGAWTVAVTRTGNALGLSESELNSLEPSDRSARIHRATEDFRRVGAHFVLETAADLVPVLDEVEGRLQQGLRP